MRSSKTHRPRFVCCPPEARPYGRGTPAQLGRRPDRGQPGGRCRRGAGGSPHGSRRPDLRSPAEYWRRGTTGSRFRPARLDERCDVTTTACGAHSLAANRRRWSRPVPPGRRSVVAIRTRANWMESTSSSRTTRGHLRTRLQLHTKDGRFHPTGPEQSFDIRLVARENASSGLDE